MTSQQRQKQKSTEALVSTRTQSLELVQTLVHSSICRIFWLRDLVSKRHFDDRAYHTDDLLSSYSNYVDGQPSTSSFSHEPKISLKILKRNSRDTVDRCLDWLEKGAFPLLKENYLQELEIRVMENASCVEDFIEAYTFAFSYIGKVGEDKLVVMDEVKGPNNTQVTIKNAKADLASSMERLNAIFKSLPDLPKARGIIMLLTLNEHCPRDYQLDGFQTIRGRTLVLSRKLSNLQSCPRIEYHGGFHNVEIVISHPAPQDPDGIFVNTTSGIQESTITGRVITCPSDSLTTQQINQCHITKITDECQDLDVDDLISVTNGNSSKHTKGLVSEHVSQEFQMSMYARNIKKLARVPQVNDSLDETQRRDEDSPPSTETPIFQPQIEPNETTIPPSIAHDYQLAFRQASPQEMLYSQAIVDKLTRNVVKGNPLAKIIVRCACIWDQLDRDLIQCAICKNWQHLVCYGYLNRNDQRIPREHFCYHCLMGTDDAGLLSDLQELALRRKAIHLFGEDGKGWTKPLQFAKKLGFQNGSGAAVASQTRNKLIEEGVLVPGPSKQKGNRVVMASSGPGKAKLDLEYRNPAHKIRHLLQDPAEPLDQDSDLDCVMTESNCLAVQVQPYLPQTNQAGPFRSLRSGQSNTSARPSIPAKPQLKRAPTPRIQRTGLRSHSTIVPETPPRKAPGQASRNVATPTVASTRKRIFHEIENSSTASRTSITSPSPVDATNERHSKIVKCTEDLIDMSLTPQGLFQN